MKINEKNSGFQLLPPQRGHCRICAVKHEVDGPHDATSFYYRFLFKNQYNRDATWNDAMLHCPEEIRKKFTDHLVKIGIDVDSIDVFGGIQTPEVLNKRLNS